MFNNNQHPETFSLFDLEDAVERSVSVLPMSRHGQTDFFSNSEILQKSKSFHFNVEEAEEQAEAFTDNCRDHETTLHPLPMYYLLDSTHLRLSAMSTFMCAYTHPLEAVLGAHKLLPSCFEIDIDMSSKRTTRTKKIKGMMWMGSECVDFRVHCFQDGSDTLIEFHRRSGSAFVFQQYFNLIAPFLVTSKNATTFVAPSLKKRRQSAQTAESIDHAFALSVKEGALAMTSFLHNENTNKNKTDTSINSLFLDTLCECLKQNGQNGTFQEGSWDTNNTNCMENNHHISSAIAALCRCCLSQASDRQVDDIVLVALLYLDQSRSQQNSYRCASTSRALLECLHKISIENSRSMEKLGALNILASLRFAVGDESATICCNILKNLQRLSVMAY